MCLGSSVSTQNKTKSEKTLYMTNQRIEQFFLCYLGNEGKKERNKP